MQTTPLPPPPSTKEHSFSVVLLRQNLKLEVAPGESITDVLQLAGVPIDTLCEQGVCGTCVTTWTEGELIHNDSCLSDEERKSQVALCCAQCTSDSLTLDL